jgi:hypothetical protein
METCFNTRVELLYVTSNVIKFGKAVAQLQPFGIQLQRVDYPFQELQHEDPQEIVLHKAQQAFAHFQQPLIVSDDTWNIPTLRGFPGPYMKQLSHWFSPQDWLQLMSEKTDRRIQLEAHLAYQDDSVQRVFSYSRNYFFLHHAEETASEYSHLPVIGRSENGPSLIREIEEGGFESLGDVSDFWPSLAKTLQALSQGEKYV